MDRGQIEEDAVIIDQASAAGVHTTRGPHITNWANQVTDLYGNEAGTSADPAVLAVAIMR